jgi:hypothetical protein
MLKLSLMTDPPFSFEARICLEGSARMGVTRWVLRREFFHELHDHGEILITTQVEGPGVDVECGRRRRHKSVNVTSQVKN